MLKIRKLITKKEVKNKTVSLALVFLSAFILRIILSFSWTLELDQNTFIAWGRQIAQNGFATFYNGWSDYLPGYLYILAFLAKIENSVPISTVVLYKLPAILADLGSAFIVYKLLKPHGERKALFGALLILFNPAVLANSTLWGQVDSLSFFFPLLSLYLFQDYIYSSAVLLGLGALVKPQPALAAISILFLFYRQKTPISKAFIYVLIAGAVFLLGFYPFFNGGNLVSFAMDRLNVTLSQYPYGSVNAFSFWGLWGFWQKESLGIFSEKNIGLVLFLVLSLVGYLKSPKLKKEYFILFFLFAANFLFFTRMHERHFLPAVMALSAVAPLFPVLIIPLALISLMYVANMYYSYVWITESFKEVFSHEMIAVFIIINLLSFVFVIFQQQIMSFLGKVFVKIKDRPAPRQVWEYVVSFIKAKDEPMAKSQNKKLKAFLVLILAFAFITRLIGLGEPNHEYFDEVYHAFTAKVVLHNDPKAWEWWNASPDGFAYEWTHPPVAKEAMALSMFVFGENAFAWRFVAAVFGVGAVFMLYKVSTKLFNEEVGVIAAAVFSLDGLTLVMSRIGMNDIYLVFFLLLTLYLILVNRNFFGGLSLGLAMASKWTTIWFVPVIVLVFLLLNKKLKLSHFWYIVLPPLVYIGTYIPMFLSGHDFEIFWGMQKQMWWYHTRLVATHPYTSRWWTWPLLLRPIWVYTSGEANGMVSNIYGMGNPAVFWGGLVAALYSLKYILVEKRKTLLFVLGTYLAMFTPWALSPRIMFFYHYFPAVPFLCLLISFVLYRNKKLIAPFFLVALILFVYFYPHWTGISIPIWLDHSYYWLPGWR